MTTPSPAAARLVALHADVQPAEVILTTPICTVGRSPMCQIVVARPVVSRLHAQIEQSGPRFLLRDLDSANGSFVNGHRLQAPRLLADRDQIGFGAPAALLAFIDPDPTATPTGQLRYDEREMRFYLGPAPVEATPTQFRLLLHLYRHLGEVCTRESVAVAVWGPDYPPGMDADTLDRLVSAVRGRLRRVQPTADFIQTRAGLGYLLTDNRA